MTEQLHRMIDSKAPQSAINERMAGIMETTKVNLERIGSDHEKRIRFLERTVGYALGAVGAVSAILYLISVIKK
jgi:hypothetical protein